MHEMGTLEEVMRNIYAAQSQQLRRKHAILN
jgi:hypothetical protein